jgi:hypothetical protein
MKPAQLEKLLIRAGLNQTCGRTGARQAPS